MKPTMCEIKTQDRNNKLGVVEGKINKLEGTAIQIILKKHTKKKRILKKERKEHQ